LSPLWDDVATPNLLNAAETGAYRDLRTALGASKIINDWSANDTDLFDVNTDWVVTTPGQYLMTRLSVYIDSLELDGDPCLAGLYDETLDDGIAPPYNGNSGLEGYGSNCDFRDIPLTVSASVWSREEEVIQAVADDLVVSPAPPTTPTLVSFDREVNVISWGTETVINEDKNVIIPTPEGAFAGWAAVSVDQWTQTTQSICGFTNWGTYTRGDCVYTDTPVPLTGFVAWERSFGDQPDANFGRIVEHAKNDLLDIVTED
jgi:hypothetical protein